MKKQNKKGKGNSGLPILAGGVVLCLVVGILIWNNGQDQKGDQNTASTKKAEVNTNAQTDEGDLKIPISDLSETATFYDAEVDGTNMEVLAVKAPDGSIRTAFNTCQVCYSSGRGYYVQDGDNLVCQNCGNTFTLNDVGESKNGCNPVPILEEDRTTDDDSITISNAFLTKYEKIFENWKAQ